MPIHHHGSGRRAVSSVFAAILSLELVALQAAGGGGAALDAFGNPTCAALTGAQSAWRRTSPEPEKPPSAFMQNDRALAFVRLWPGTTGPARTTIAVLTGDFQPIAARNVGLTLERPGAAPIRIAATRGAEPDWVIDRLVLPAPGRWRVQVEIGIAGGETVRLEGSIEVRS